MAQVTKIDSNATGLRYAEETSYNTAPASGTWYPLEPNEYDDFGGEYTLIARRPINDSRQRKKGVITDLDSMGGLQTDVTQDNITDLMQGFFFADLSQQGTVTAANATGTTDLFDVADTTGFVVGNLVYAQGYVNAGNNGLHIITTVNTNVSIEVLGSTLVTETAPADATVVVVGHEFDLADANSFAVDASGSLPTISSDLLTTGFITDLGLEAGEWIYVGDGTNDFEGDVNNNGFKRIQTLTEAAMTIDKSQSAMATDDGSDTGSGGSFVKSIYIFFGKFLRNRQAANIVRRSYHLERVLGARDDAEPTLFQYEYVTGAVPSEFEIEIPVAEKLMAQMTFMGASTDRRDTSTGGGETQIDAGGTRPAVQEADAFNTSSDVSRIRLAVYDETNEAPTALFSYAEEINLTLNNNINPLKAVGVLGNFEVTAGLFEVSGEITAYFADVASVDAIADNSDVTVDIVLVKSNAGIIMDVPLIALGDGKIEVEQDEAIKIPLDMQAADGSKLHEDLDFSLSMTWFDYLPSVAETTP